MSKRPELTAAERALPYAKFYDLPITPIPEEKLAVLAAGPIDPSLALKIEDRNDLFKPGYLPCEIGYCVMPNGTGFLANRTEMPGVTPEMFEWWFAWHSLEDLRYRIWDPEDHYYARQQMREKTLDQSLPMRERTWGTVHHVLEDIGPGPTSWFWSSAIHTSWAMRRRRWAPTPAPPSSAPTATAPSRPGRGGHHDPLRPRDPRRHRAALPLLDRLRPGGRQAGQAGARRRVRPGGGTHGPVRPQPEGVRPPGRHPASGLRREQGQLVRRSRHVQEEQIPSGI